MKKAYGDAYFLDTSGKWRYVHDNRLVPNSTVYVDPDTGEIGMNAPELLAHQLIDAEKLAGILRVQRPSVYRMLRRGQICKPQFEIDGAPVWTRPIIANWKAHRPGKGAHLRGSRRSAA